MNEISLEQDLRNLLSAYVKVAPHESNREGIHLHTSAYNRYSPIADVLFTSQLEVPQEIKEIRSLLSASVLLVRECASGEGSAITQLIHNFADNNRHMKLYINGYEDPKSTISVLNFNYLVNFAGSPLIDIAQNRIYQRDLREPHPEEDNVDLAIIGFVHQYMSENEFINAVTNTFLKTKVLVLIPANSRGIVQGDNGGYRNALFIYSLNGELKTYINEVNTPNNFCTIQ
jgi:hypothetical protein